MNLRFVEAFYWVATLRSVTRAAEKLFLTQSAMSSRVAALERELGVPLLDRRDRQFRLTPAGQRFAVHAQRLLELQRAIKAEIAGGAAGQALVLRLGAIEPVLHAWLVPLLLQLRTQYAEIEFQLRIASTPVLLDQARRGALDLVFAARPAAGDDLRTRPLPPLEMVLAGHAGLHRRARYRPHDLAGLDLLTFPRGSQPHGALLELFRQAGLAPGRLHTLNSIPAMAALVEGGFGVATLPRAAAAGMGGRRRLRVLRLEPALPPLPLFASYRADPTSAAVETVAQAVFDFIAQGEAG